MLEDYPGTFTVAEVGGPTPIQEMRAFTQGEKRLNSAYNFDFLYAPSLDASRVMMSASHWDQSEGEGWPSWAFSNHDAPRAVSRWAPADHRDEMARLYMMLLLTLRGNPIIYQGEELGLPQAQVPFSHLKDPEAIANWPKTLGRDGARTPMPWESDKLNSGFSSGEPWLPVDEAHAALAVDRQQGNDSVLRFTSEALAARKQLQAILTGGMTFVETGQEAFLALRRNAGQEEVTALFNLSGTPVALDENLVRKGYLALSSKPLKEDLLQTRLLPERTGVWVRAEK